MPDPLTRINQALEEHSPAVYSSLSPFGRRVVFPPDIPFQAGQARGKAFNGTIGQITDGRGGPLTLPSLAGALGALDEGERARAALYSPVQGMPTLRGLWRDRQRRGIDPRVPSSLPLVTVGLTHGLSLAADLFTGEGRAVVVPSPFWGNYRQVFATRTGARMVMAESFAGGLCRPQAFAAAVAAQPAGEPVVVILNFPSNPGGYSPTVEERARIRTSLVAEAEGRPLVVLADDAYAGLVYDDEIPRGSLFWELAGAHPNLVAVKVDGATKEVSFFGGRVGFITFGVAEGSPAAEALESKVKCLLRATLGSPVATSQVILERALSSETLEEEIDKLRGTLARRVGVLKEALAGCDSALFRILPFNSGCFALLELPEKLGLASEQVRRHLLDHEDTGVIAIAPRYLRIAHCSVAAEQIPELVKRLERGVRELAARS